MLWRQYWRHFWGAFFTGAYLPQKSVLSPPIASQYKPFQKHVSSYWANRSPGCVVWAAPTLCLKGSELPIVIYCIVLNLELTCSILNYD
jgi:hypothetical protein